MSWCNNQNEHPLPDFFRWSFTKFSISAHHAPISTVLVDEIDYIHSLQPHGCHIHGMTNSAPSLAPRLGWLEVRIPCTLMRDTCVYPNTKSRMSIFCTTTHACTVSYKCMPHHPSISALKWSDILQKRRPSHWRKMCSLQKQCTHCIMHPHDSKKRERHRAYVSTPTPAGLWSTSMLREWRVYVPYQRSPHGKTKLGKPGSAQTAASSIQSNYLCISTTSSHQHSDPHIRRMKWMIWWERIKLFPPLLL